MINVYYMLKCYTPLFQTSVVNVTSVRAMPYMSQHKKVTPLRRSK